MDTMKGVNSIIEDAAGLLFSRDHPRSKHLVNSYHIEHTVLIESSFNNHHEKKLEKDEAMQNCANKICKNHNQHAKDQPQQICPQTLCFRCSQQFQKDAFCIYCKQIYFDETDDGKQWIMCEECMRWVHSQCADFNTKENPNAQFQCIKCKKIESLPNGRRNIPRTGYAKLEKKKNSQFLNSIGFQWELATHQISEDMESIRKYLG